MDTYRITLDPAVARLYEEIARCAQTDTEKVLSDALFLLAGMLTLDALTEKADKSAGR